MKNLRYTLLLAFMIFLSSHALPQSKAEKELKETEKKAAEERERAFGGKKMHSTLGSKKMTGESKAKDQAENKQNGEQTSDDKSSQVISSNEDQNQSEKTTGESTNPDQSNSPAVNQTTTSESGSPAILSHNNGEGRDGTNNRQRATYKMAGAEIKGDLGLSRKEGENLRSPSKVLKQEEQPALVRDRSESSETTDENVLPDKQSTDKSVKPEPKKKQSAKDKQPRKTKSKKSKARDAGK
jgi:hypothetical protein